MENIDIKKIDEYRWEIPKKGDMLVPGRIYGDKNIIDHLVADVRAGKEWNALRQIVNVACLPGIQKASLAMSDVHPGYGFCCHPDTKILSGFGYLLPIKDYKKVWKGERLKTLDKKAKEINETKISKFLKIRAGSKVFKLTTKSGKEITATADHPFFTKNGMVIMEKLSLGNEVAVLPFEGVPYEKPLKKTIVFERDVEKTLLELGRVPGEVGFDQNIRALKKRGLLRLSYDHPKLPYIIKIMGFVFGDGTMNLIGKRRDGIIQFSGKGGDLEKIRQDIKALGYVPSPLHKRRSNSSEFVVNAASLMVLLKTLGQPMGRKVFQAYDVPRWIMRAPLWQKRLFLASLFGAELRRPHLRKGRETMFNCPVFPMSKSGDLIQNGMRFLKDISKMLKEFGVETRGDIIKRRKHVNTTGEISWALELVFSSKIDSLINLWSKIGFEYNSKRNFEANVSVQYLRYKQRILEEKDHAVKVLIPALLKTGMSYRKIGKKLANDVMTERFISSVCFKLKKKRAVMPNVSPSFPRFSEYVKKSTRALGRSGIVWDEIVELKEVSYDGDVYDFTVLHKDHNFIANNFVVSNCIGGVGAFDLEKGVISVAGVGYDVNCGVRTLETDLTREDVEKKKKELAEALFDMVPAGLGSTGDIRLSVDEIDEVLVKGAEFAVSRGYGFKEDLEFTEENGRVAGAKPENVSMQAKQRQFKQVGTLGSGNHYLEVQYVEAVFDEKVAGAYGLRKDQILISIHCGSRALGHQIGTDYLKTLEAASKKYKIPIKEKELVCAPFNSEEGRKYFSAVNCGINMAFANRQAIAHLTRKAIKKSMGVAEEDVKMLYDIGHNTAKLEKHDGRELLLLRKGSTRAFGPGREEVPKVYRSAGQPVLIGGTMGTSSYILHGTQQGMEETFGSACHGAGRAMSRQQAKHQWRGEQLVHELAKKGIIIKGHSLGGVAEEAPGAYKDVTEVVDVMHNSGIAKKVALLKPMISIKG